MLINNHKGTDNNSNHNQSDDDDDYDDNGSGIEDDAPEGFQALQRPEQAIITFPDLLRVPTTTANMDPEDDSPESLSFASGSGQSVGQAIRPSELHMPGPSTGQRSNSNACSEPIGGLPRNRRPLSHPDVSQMNLSFKPSSSGTFPTANVSSSSIPFDQQQQQPTARPLPPLPACDQDRIPPPICRNSVNSSDPISAQALAPILNAITRIQSSVETLSRQFNERLDAMENRINEVTHNAVGNQPNSNQLTPEFLRNFMSDQKREMDNQRRSLVLSFAEALRLAADPPNQNGSVKSPNSPNHKPSPQP